MTRQENDEITIDLLELAKFILKRVYLVVLLAVVVGGVVFAFNKFMVTPLYEASVNMIVNTRQDTTANVTNDQLNSAKSLVDTYAIIIKSDVVLDEVIENTNLVIDYETLYKQISVTDLNDTQVMRVSVEDPDPQMASEIVREISEIAPDVIVDAVGAGSCKVISKVAVTSHPVSPNVSRNTAVGALIGVIIAIGILTLMFLLKENHIVDDEDLKKYSELSALGVIPEVDEKASGAAKNSTKRTLVLSTAKDMPFAYVEAYKSLRTNLKFLTASSGAKSFVITSALSMESKSNVSINLCASMAEENKKVILIDADLRKPGVTRLLHMHSSTKGLTDLLMGECTFGDVVVHDPELNIDVLPAGTIPPNPAEVLSMNSMAQMIATLKRYYDYVIVDAPPVAVVTDAAIIGGLVDGALLVIRSDYAPVEMVRMAIDRLESVKVKIFGAILTRFDAKKAGRQSGYYYSYHDYYSYGYSDKTENSASEQSSL